MARAAAGAAAYLVHRIGRRSDATDEETDADLAEDELGTQPMWESTGQSESEMRIAGETASLPANQ